MTRSVKSPSSRGDRSPRAPAPKSQTPTLVAALLGDLGFPALTARKPQLSEQCKDHQVKAPLRTADNAPMTPEEFVEAIQQVVYQTAVDGTVRQLQQPSGRRPAELSLALHEWYEGLSLDDRTMVTEALRRVADLATFGFLCVLDGVRVIDDPPHGELRLTFTDAEGVEHVLNSHAMELHDLFRGSGARG